MLSTPLHPHAACTHRQILHGPSAVKDERMWNYYFQRVATQGTAQDQVGDRLVALGVSVGNKAPKTAVDGADVAAMGTAAFSGAAQPQNADSRAGRNFVATTLTSVNPQLVRAQPSRCGCHDNARGVVLTTIRLFRSARRASIDVTWCRKPSSCSTRSRLECVAPLLPCTLHVATCSFTHPTTAAAALHIPWRVPEPRARWSATWPALVLVHVVLWR